MACGSIESPALLLRSGIGGPAVGEYLRLHPTGAMTGVYDDPQDWWWGPPQSAISHQFAEGRDGHGFLVEWRPPRRAVRRGLALAVRARPQGRMLARSTTSGLINLTRDHGHGRVNVDQAGNAVPNYRLTDELDVANFRAGLAELIRIHEAAGAERISAWPQAALWSAATTSRRSSRRLRDCSLAPREYAVFTAHQMGSCRMGADPATTVADPWGQLHDTKGVWIGDASAFPTASGVNPMLTIMALARRTAGAIAAA